MAVSGLNAGNYTPIPVTGYNEDMVVEQGAGKSEPLTGV